MPVICCRVAPYYAADSSVLILDRGKTQMKKSSPSLYVRRYISIESLQQYLYIRNLKYAHLTPIFQQHIINLVFLPANTIRFQTVSTHNRNF